MACSARVAASEHPFCNSTSLLNPASTSPLPSRKRQQHPVAFSRTGSSRGGALQITKAGSAESSSDAKIANLFAKRKERVKLPNSHDGRGINEFLCHPSGIESILNKKSFRTFESLDSNTYRCTLPKMKFLNFEVSPVLDLRVTLTTEDCTVELLSCKFQGSKALERQNDRFLAFMRNHMTWDANGSEQFLDLDIELNISLEVYTQPFNSLPISAVEKPGNLIMQSLVDRLSQMLLQQLLQDYDQWVQEQCNVSP